MNNKIEIIAKQLTDNKYKENIELFKTLSNVDKFWLNKYYDFNFNINIIEYNKYDKLTTTDDNMLFWSCEHNAILLMSKLLNKGVYVNNRDCNYSTVLIRATMSNYTKMVKLLLQQPNIDVNVRNDYKNTALLYAATNNYYHIVKLLLQHPNINVNCKDEYGRTALMWASSFGFIKVVRLLLQHPNICINDTDNFNKSALDVAETDEINQLLKNHEKHIPIL